ncbi:glycosyltransferase [Lithospermum erythrorhizon]|uniref:Glycosyltransferase n=1 Tax=Lithospermum erythrorhizon TaxID=34254 RepID=A0AAV3PCS5_LITER
MEKQELPHVALFVTTGMGHWIPVLEFAKSLNSFENHNFTCTLIAPTYAPLSKNEESFLESLPNGIDFIALPPATSDYLHGLVNVKGETRVVLNVRSSLSAFRDVVRELMGTKTLVALVVDLFGTDAFDVAMEFNIPPYIFFPPNAMNLSLFLHMQELDKKVSGQYKDLTTPIEIPGCFPIYGKDLADPFQDRKNDSYKWLLHTASKYKLAEGIIVNTFQDLEPVAIKTLQELGNPQIYPIGPLTQNGLNYSSENCECVRWLNEQPLGSVLYVSFGSGGALTHKQMNELAMGLELSNQRFLWVIKCPSNVPSGSYFGLSNQDPKAFLPNGFLDRVKGRGLLVSNWAPQVPILNHGSIGGFLTHCGWNSTLESMVNGIPLIVWPLYAEQRLNAVMLTQELKVALRPKVGENGLVKADVIANTVKNLIVGEEGKQVRNRMRDIKVAAERVLRPDGSSRKSLANLVSLWSSKMSM